MTGLHVSLHLSGTTWVVACAFAVYRLTRLVIRDEITEPARQWVNLRATSRPRWLRVAYFLTCPWCVGIWMAAAVAVLVALWPTGAAYIVLVLSWSAATGLIADRVD